MFSSKELKIKSPFLKILVIAFLVEAIAMILLPLLVSEGAASVPAAILDATVLTLLMSPFLWWFVIRPIRTSAEQGVHVAESALRETNEKLRALIQASPLAIISLNPDGRVLSWNQAAERIFGWSEQETIGRPLPFIPPDKQNEFRLLHARVRRGESFMGIERRRLKKDGSSIFISISAAPVYDAGGDNIGTMSVIADITEHKRAEEKINRLNRVYAMLSAVNKAIVHVRDRDKLFEEACRIAVVYGGFRMAWIGVIEPGTLTVKPAAHYGFEEGYLERVKITAGNTRRGRGPTGTAIRSGKHFVCNDIEHDPSMLPWREEALKRGYRSNASFPVLLGAKAAAAITFYADAPDFFNEEEINLLDELALDISFALEFMEKEKLRKAAENLALEAKQDWEDTFDTMTDMITIHDKDFNIIRANRAAEKILSLPALNLTQGKCFTYYHGSERPPDDCLSCRSLATGNLSVTEFFEPHLNRFLEIQAIPRHDARNNILGLIHVVRDITEQKKLEAQLRHAQKMEAVGTLTGGIAHDFNNILTAIIGYANILKLKMRPDDPVRLYAEQILASTERAASLTQGLLAFSRKSVFNLKPVDLNEIVERIEKLLHRLIGEDIALRTELTGRETVVLGDSSQIEQVLMNLVTNARDAMPDGGELSVSTDIVELGNDFISAQGYGKEGVYAVITVADTGIGMDDQTRDRIFEPFFTTKDVGKGTGLGLSIVYGIMKQHNGFITCTSAPRAGTTFTLHLPLVKAQIHKPESKAPLLPRGGAETVLIAEDDPEVRRLTKTILKDFGYTVIEAEDGDDAVRKFRENKSAVDILLFDVVMPKKDGKEALDEIRQLKPGIKSVLMSGYDANTVAQKGIRGDGVEFLVKPISPAALLDKIREVLEHD